MTQEQKVEHNPARNERRRQHPNPDRQLAKQSRMLHSMGSQLVNALTQEMEEANLGEGPRIVNGFIVMLVSVVILFVDQSLIKKEEIIN